MSAGGAFGGARGYQPRPPEKGVFPLDHFGECSKVKDAYLECLKAESHSAKACTALSRQYLECRMQRNLMAHEDLDRLGLAKEKSQSALQPEPKDLSLQEDRKRKGFVAGVKAS